MMTTVTVRTRPPAQPPRCWRVTTAARVFVLALITGQVLSAGDLAEAGIVLLALATLASAASAIESELTGAIPRWVPVAEGVLAAVLIGTTGGPVAPFLVYLALPPVVAGIRWGWVSALNSGLATGLAATGCHVAAEALRLGTPQLSGSLPWVAVGLGTGLLAAWQTRSVRALEEAQAPYAAAHRLLSQLRTLSLQLPGGLDSQTVAQRLVDLASPFSPARTAVLVRSSDGTMIPMAEGGALPGRPDEERQVARCCCERTTRTELHRLVALPLRVGEHTFGALVMTGQHGRKDEELDALQSLVDEQALRLETALLFEEVRALATAEERGRLAREIHDGAAQEIASLGYLVDDVAADITDPATRGAVEELRGQVTRVVNELRLSIFDLRHGIPEEGSLGRALADYVREVSVGTGLRAHLLLDEQPTPLPPRTQAELLRIGQEAIANARKHAHATNLWVALTTDGRHARLRVEDDGVGSPRPRPHHYGLHSMRERAERINADFAIAARSEGGTTVTVQTRPLHPTDPTARGVHHGVPRTAHR